MNKIYPIFNRAKGFLGQSRQLQRDILAFHIINPFLPDGANYFPITGFSINPHTLACVLNDIKINQRRSMIEFGGGLSTLCCAKFARLNNLDFQLVTVESDSDYLSFLENCLIKESLNDCVELIYAPLEPTSLSLENSSWYSERILKNKIVDLQFDILLIDGPRGGTPKNHLSRFPAFPFLTREKMLADKYSIFFDDANRKGEKMCIQKIQSDHQIKFINFSEVASVAFRGKYFNPLVW